MTTRLPKLTFALLTILFCSLVYAQPEPYISPGISISWAKGTTVFGWKLSFGCLGNVASKSIHAFFVNITAGKKFGLDNKRYSYWYTQLESGIVNGFLFSGAGFGTAYLNNGKYEIIVVPKGSVFSGALVFARSDFFIYHNRLFIDFGGQAVLPLSRLLFNPPDIGVPFGN